MKVVIVSGPTASGKTQTAIDLALAFGGEVVNFDSLLLYQELTIGTAKPTLEERKGVPHHMIDVSSIRRPFNAAHYAEMALPLVQELLHQNQLVYLVGGSGFYLQALLKGMYNSPTCPDSILKRSDELYEQHGIDPFLAILSEHDPESFKRYHPNDHYRIRRAVEHWWSHQTPLSAERMKKDLANLELAHSNIHAWETLHLYLDMPKEEHLQFITQRTHSMINQGLIQEVEELLQQGFTGNEKPLQSIGYYETLEFLRGEIPRQDALIEKIIISTRQLAKAQRTWFKKDPFKIKLHPLKQKSDSFSLVEKFLKSKALLDEES